MIGVHIFVTGPITLLQEMPGFFEGAGGVLSSFR